jgi:hypothetical protein
MKCPVQGSVAEAPLSDELTMARFRRKPAAGLIPLRSGEASMPVMHFNASWTALQVTNAMSGRPDYCSATGKTGNMNSDLMEDEIPREAQFYKIIVSIQINSPFN